jgi:hypothetical protein
MTPTAAGTLRSGGHTLLTTARHDSGLVMGAPLGAGDCVATRLLARAIAHLPADEVAPPQVACRSTWSGAVSASTAPPAASARAGPQSDVASAGKDDLKDAFKDAC